MMRILFLVLTLFFGLNVVKGQWQPDVRLTNDPASSTTSYDNTWCIAAGGLIVHIVWFDYRDGNQEIYYKRSSDGGITWGTDTRLTNSTGSSLYPSISVTGNFVHIAWYDTRDGNQEIYYKRSTDSGLNWGPDTRLTNNLAISEHLCLCASGTIVHVSWEDMRDANWEIYYKRSSDGGLSWGPDTRLTNNPAYSWDPTVVVSGQLAHLIWRDYRDGNYEIYYKRSTDSGISWGNDTRLTYNENVSYNSCQSMGCSNSNIHIVWSSNREGNYEIYYKRSTDGGINWSTDIRLTNDPAVSENPSIVVSGSLLHIVWHDNRTGNYGIYYKRSTDGGLSWEPDLRLSANPSYSNRPSVTVSGIAVHLVWNDYRDGNTEIYYKRNPTGNMVGISGIYLKVPENYLLSQNYPNPFNPSTTIEYQLPEAGYVKLTVFDVLGQEVKSLVNEYKQAGSYNVKFDASELPSGVYFYKMSVINRNGEFFSTKKMLLVK